MILGQYLDYIDNLGVKSLVLVAIACISIYVPLHSLGGYNVFVAKKVYFVDEGYSVLAYLITSEHASNDAWIQRDRDVLARKLEFRLWLKNTTSKKSKPFGFVEKAI